jgi:hypothetical protein
MSGPLDRLLNDALMLGASARYASRQDLGTLDQILLEKSNVLVVDSIDLVGTHATDLSPSKEELFLT